MINGRPPPLRHSLDPSSNSHSRRRRRWRWRRWRAEVEKRDFLLRRWNTEDERDDVRETERRNARIIFCRSPTHYSTLTEVVALAQGEHRCCSERHCPTATTTVTKIPLSASPPTPPSAASNGVDALHWINGRARARTLPLTADVTSHIYPCRTLFNPLRLLIVLAPLLLRLSSSAGRTDERANVPTFGVLHQPNIQNRRADRPTHTDSRVGRPSAPAVRTTTTTTNTTITTTTTTLDALTTTTTTQRDCCCLVVWDPPRTWSRYSRPNRTDK